MTTIFEITELNTPLVGSVTKASNRQLMKPAFYKVNTTSDEVYGGSTGSISKRLNKHKRMLLDGTHPVRALQAAHDAGEVLKVEVTYTENRDQAFDTEQKFLDANKDSPKLLNKALNARLSRQGISPSEFNIQRIKETHTNKVVSVETRAKLSKALKGKEVSEEQRQKLREANLGKKHSAETIEKCRQASLGKVITDETRAKISQAKKGKGFPKEAKAACLEKISTPVVCKGVSYPSFAAAARALGVSDVCIRNWVFSTKPEHKDYQLG